MRRMLITLTFSVVAKKLRTFSSLPYSANEQACRSWEGAQPGSQPKLASGNIPYHRHHIQFINVDWCKGRTLSFLRVQILSCPGVWSFSWILQNSQNPGDLSSVLAAWGLAENKLSRGENDVLYIVCFAKSLLSLLLLIVVVSHLLSY